MKSINLKLECLVLCLCLLISSSSFGNAEKPYFTQQTFQTLLTSVKNKIEHEKTKYSNSIHGKEDLHNKTLVKKKLYFLARIDQIVRNELITPVFEAEEHIHDKDGKYNTASQYMADVDAFTIKQLEQILAIHQWITKKEFGKKAALAAWLVLHHSQDNLLKYKVLFILEHLIQQKAAEPDSYTLLYDSLAIELIDSKFNIKQRYGTQFRTKKAGEFEPYPYEGTLQELNKRRLAIGLDSMESYVARMKASLNCKVRL